MPKPKKRVVFLLRFWFICAGLLFVLFIPILRSQDYQVRQQQELLAKLQKESYNEEVRGKRLNDQVENASSSVFREREARRRYGFVFPGVIRFVADGVQSDSPAGEDDATVAGDPAQPSTDADTQTTKDWSNF